MFVEIEEDIDTDQISHTVKLFVIKDRKTYLLEWCLYKDKSNHNMDVTLLQSGVIWSICAVLGGDEDTK